MKCVISFLLSRWRQPRLFAGHFGWCIALARSPRHRFCGKRLEHIALFVDRVLRTYTVIQCRTSPFPRADLDCRYSRNQVACAKQQMEFCHKITSTVCSKNCKANKIFFPFFRKTSQQADSFPNSTVARTSRTFNFIPTMGTSQGTAESFFRDDGLSLSGLRNT